jgi:SAM-dependent methyltransferase
MSAVDLGPHASLERMNRFQEPEARRIIGELGLPAGSRGLDVGCGVGLYALWLAEAVGQGGRVVAIEPELAKVEAARALVGGRPPGTGSSSSVATARPFSAGWEPGLGVVGDAAPHRDTEKARSSSRGPAGRPRHVKESQVFGHVLPGTRS